MTDYSQFEERAIDAIAALVRETGVCPMCAALTISEALTKLKLSGELRHADQYSKEARQRSRFTCEPSDEAR